MESGIEVIILKFWLIKLGFNKTKLNLIQGMQRIMYS